MFCCYCVQQLDLSEVQGSIHPPQFPLSLGRDVIAQAQSGTGKTATFAISILQSLDISKKSCQALVLAPTRELAQQIQKVCVWQAPGKPDILAQKPNFEMYLKIGW